MSGKLTVLQNVGLSGVSPHRATLTINQSGPQGPAGTPGTGMQDTGEPHGFPNRTDSALSFDNSQREFTITPTGASFDVWCSGTKHTFTTAQSVTLPATSGLYYIYFNGGVLGYGTTYFDWPTQAPTAYVYWNADAGAVQFFADERHGITLDWQTHEYLHRTRGAAMANGFVLSSYTTTGTGSANSDATVALADGTFFDEDLQVDIVNDPSPTPNTWEQRLSTTLYAPVFYRTGAAGVWTRDTATAYPLKSGTSLATYNLNTGGTWTTPDLGNNKYGLSWLVATNNLSEPVIALLGQGQYSNVENALDVTWEDMDLTGFPVVEFRPLWKVVYQTATSYTNTPKARLRAVQDLRGQLPVAAGASANDHGSLAGLLDDDHAQYEPNEVRVSLVGEEIDVTTETRIVMVSGGIVNLPDAASRAGSRHVTVIAGADTTVTATGTDVIGGPLITSLALKGGVNGLPSVVRLAPLDATTFIGTWIWFPIERSGAELAVPLWWDPVAEAVVPDDGDIVTMSAGIPVWAPLELPEPVSTEPFTERPWTLDGLSDSMERSTNLWLRCHPSPNTMDGSYDGTWQIVNESNDSGTLPPTPDGIDIRAEFYLHPPYEDAEIGVSQAWPYQRFRELLTQTKAEATGGDLTEWAVLHTDSSHEGQRVDGAAIWFYESTLTGAVGEGSAFNYDDGGRLIGVTVRARLTHDTATETVRFWRWVPYNTGASGVEQTADGYWWQPVGIRNNAQYASMDPDGTETWKIGIQNRMDLAWMTVHEFGGAKILDIQPEDIAAAGIGATSFTDSVGNTIETVSGEIGYGGGSHPAGGVSLDASGFSGNLSATDTDVQTALATFDAYVPSIPSHGSSHESGGDDELALDATQISSGTLDTARLGSGAASSSTYLRGDQTWQSISGASERPPSLIVAEQYVTTAVISTGNSGVTSNRLFFAPIYITRTTSFDSIGINHAATAAGAGSVARLGIYNSTDDLPSTLVLDAGTVDLSTAAGFKEVTISPAQSLSVGVYWLAVVAQVTSGSPTFASGAPIMPVPSNNATFAGTKFQAGVSGTLPATATPGAANTTQPPVIFLRAVP